MPALAFHDQRVGPTPASAILEGAEGLRVAVVSDAISGRNGVGTYYPDLIHHLGPYLDQIQLIAPEDEVRPSTESFALPMPGDPTQRIAWPRRAALYAKLDEIEPNLLVIPSLGPYAFFALRYARKKRVPIALVQHTDFGQLLSLYWPSWISWPTRRVLNALNTWLNRQAAAVGTVDPEALEKVKQGGAKLARVLGTPLDSAFLSEPTLPLPDKITRAIYVGRLAQEKGLGQILEAARTLPNVNFTIAGDGPLKQAVETAATEHENLTYLGWLPRPRVREEIDAAEILLLPSANETFGTVALEALARRRLVIVSSECGIANWPDIAKGIFQTTAERDLIEVLQDIQAMPPAQRDAFAGKSWDAVPAFNDQVIRTWLFFLVEAAGADQ